MADLGTLELLDPVTVPLPLELVTDYDVTRGNYLGEISLLEVVTEPLDLREPQNYIVRALSILYRQLWPSHGQRFPQ